ncbi:MAG: ECF-type sigma factor [Candidatus Cyclobacteriaceae bacterium M3_2C_046]
MLPEKTSIADLKHMFQECYQELNLIAHKKLGYERANHTLDTTGLVHEVYDKLYHQTKARYQNTSHFLAIASVTMRRILINYARSKNRVKRGGDQIRMTYGNMNLPLQTTPEEIINLHEALHKLKKLNYRQSKVVEFHFFGGFKHQEIAKYLDVSEETVRRDWRLAKAWLGVFLKKQA